MEKNVFECDGCGQKASPGHLAKRLKRLQQATRYRPIHIQTLFLGAAAPRNEAEFIYEDQDARPTGEAALVLAAAGISLEDSSRTDALQKFQRGGFYLTHVLECPFDESLGPNEREKLLVSRFPAALVRLKRSLRPKRVTLITAELSRHAKMLQEDAPDLEIVILAEGAGRAVP